jgi:hypothetical protein
MLELLSIGRVVGGGGGPLGSLAPHIGIEDPSPSEDWHWLGSSGRLESSGGLRPQSTGIAHGPSRILPTAELMVPVPASVIFASSVHGNRSVIHFHVIWMFEFSEATAEAIAPFILSSPQFRSLL